MIDFLGGAVTLAYLIAMLYFFQFWRRTSDRLFLNFGVAFLLLALNQVLVTILGMHDDRSNYAYILRVIGFVLILFAIFDKNLLGSAGKRKRS